MKENINTSLELLLLNDLLRTKAIDKDIYDKAAQKITVFSNTARLDTPIIRATA